MFELRFRPPPRWQKQGERYIGSTLKADKFRQQFAAIFRRLSKSRTLFQTIKGTLSLRRLIRRQRQLRSAVEVKLSVDVMQVHLHGAFAQMELAGDFLVA